MTFGGKTVDQMSLEELEYALVFCHRHMKECERLYRLNQAGMAEISEEIDRREHPETLN
jgi:hypothetical protein